jgi:hypothetical protein
MALHVFVFLLVVCLLLTLARLGRLEWFQLRPSSSQDGAKCSRFPRLLKPRSPDDCPACRLASPPSSAVVPVPVRPWREGKSRRGAPKRINTEGFACPNPQCLYFRITEAHIHAAFRRWQAWPCRADPDVSLPGLSHHVQCPTRYSLVSPENPLAAGRRGALGSGRRARPFRGRTGLRLPTSHHCHLVDSRRPARSDLARALLPQPAHPAYAVGRTANPASERHTGSVSVVSH